MNRIPVELITSYADQVCESEYLRMNFTSVTIGLPVKNLAEASRWYEQNLGLDAHIDPVSDIREYELVPGCWLQLSETDTTLSDHCVLLGVADLEAARDRLAEAGVAVGEIQRVEGVISFFDFKDPDGNNLGLYRVEHADTA